MTVETNQPNCGLHSYLVDAASRWRDQAAVEDPTTGHSVTYSELDALAAGIRDRLVHLGVRPGDRVGIYLTKSIDAVASIYGVLYCGAAYVPVDPDSPASRNAFIHNDCEVSATIVEDRFVNDYRDEIEKYGSLPRLMVVAPSDHDLPIGAALEREQSADPAAETTTTTVAASDLAYILYTSGSTGKPKGVMLTHVNGTSYIDWCSNTFQPTEQDRSSSHAPLHFDLSILDVFMPARHGSTLVLIDAATGKDPVRLARLISHSRISIWYSAPSILSLMAQFGKLPDYDYRKLRIVLFAGEVFPIKHLRALHALWPDPMYYNLYGPTETNVCTYFKVPAAIEPERTQPYPIGRTCEQLESRVIDTDGAVLPSGQEGELIVRGPGVTQGYWNLPERNEVAFHVDESGSKWYKTGDLVIRDDCGDYLFLGRRDRMIKKRGYRIELGEIESALYAHPEIKETAVIAGTDNNEEIMVHCFYATESRQPISMIALKTFCSKHLPKYMIPDRFRLTESLPRTSTDKVDYKALEQLA